MCVEGVEGGSGLLFRGPTLITGPLTMWCLCQHLLSPQARDRVCYPGLVAGLSVLQNVSHRASHL